MVELEEMRKGPWTEEEDVQLIFYVNLFGDRRWDFIAKVSGLQRWRETVYRLRWVNYLNPGLKRGKMTPHEERLVLELHSKWGNRWSRIARKIPGRTDNEIKNYWRTHMRKKAQEKKKQHNISSSASSSTYSTISLSNSNCSSTISSSKGNCPTDAETKERNFYDTGGLINGPATGGGGDKVDDQEEEEDIYTLDEIWKDIELPEYNNNSMKPNFDACFIEGSESYFLPSQNMVAAAAAAEAEAEAEASPVWNCSLWTTEEEEECKMLPTKNTSSLISEQFYSFYSY